MDDAARADELARRIISAYPRARVVTREDREPGLSFAKASLSPKRTLVLKRHRGRFIKPFPAHPWYRSGRSFNLVLGFNCFASCQYCFVHTYFDDPYPTMFANVDAVLDELREFLKENPRAWISTGEFMDSLQLDRITRHTERLMETLRGFPSATLELRTKHHDVAHIPPCGQPGVVFSFSINPPVICRKVESGSADLTERLAAAKKLHDKGYPITFRIDPIIATPEYRDAYGGLAETIEAEFGWRRVSKVYMGVMRFGDGLFRRFAHGNATRRLLDAEYIVAPDGKYRPYKHARVEVYRRLAAAIRRYQDDIESDLVMEPDYVHGAVSKDV